MGDTATLNPSCCAPHDSLGVCSRETLVFKTDLQQQNSAFLTPRLRRLGGKICSLDTCKLEPDQALTACKRSLPSVEQAHVIISDAWKMSRSTHGAPPRAPMKIAQLSRWAPSVLDLGLLPDIHIILEARSTEMRDVMSFEHHPASVHPAGWCRVVRGFFEHWMACYAPCSV